MGVIQHATANTASVGFVDTLDCFFGAPTAAGNSIILAIGSAFGSPATPIDDETNSYSNVASVNLASFNGGAQLFRADGIAAGTVKVTANLSRTDAFFVDIYECTPLDAADITITKIAAGFSVITPGTATPADASEFAISLWGSGSNVSGVGPGAGWTAGNPSSFGFGGSQFQELTSIALLDGAFGNSGGSWAAIMATFPFKSLVKPRVPLVVVMT
jgi:hypothetical protein